MHAFRIRAVVDAADAMMHTLGHILFPIPHDSGAVVSGVAVDDLTFVTDAVEHAH